MTASVKERVEAGFALLDEHKPGWYTKIDLDRLNVKSDVDCTLAQIYEDETPADRNPFAYALQLLFDYDERGAVFHGFATGGQYSYRELTVEWKRQIEARLLKDRVTGEALAAAETFLGIGQDEWDALMPATHLVGLG